MNWLLEIFYLVCVLCIYQMYLSRLCQNESEGSRQPVRVVRQAYHDGSVLKRHSRPYGRSDSGAEKEYESQMRYGGGIWIHSVHKRSNYAVVPETGIWTRLKPGGLWVRLPPTAPFMSRTATYKQSPFMLLIRST